MHKRLLDCFILLALLCPGTRAETPSAEALEFFEKRVRPVLAENCYQCHSAQSQKLKGGLLLDSPQGALQGGDSGPALVPGKPDQSLLIKAVKYADDLQMPPKSKLKDEQIADLEKWVRDGGAWPGAPPVAIANEEAFDLKERAKHWAFQALKSPVPPSGINPIDHFIQAKLREHGLTPNARADKRTLIRRATFDLIGLPPTPQETEAFLADNSENAFEKVVDRLLASPHYGERWARHWLDLVRYAETGGHEFDPDYPTAWGYRDYVIRALNADLPYNQFVVEHIAGDLLAPDVHPGLRRHPTERFNESILATGFWFLHESIHSPVDIREDEANRIDNQIDVFSKTFLGLTVACARCHDHKFDAISQKDYYALAGFLQSSRFQEAFLDEPSAARALIDELSALRRELGKAAVSAADGALGNPADLLNRAVAAVNDPKKIARLPVLQPWAELSKAPATDFEWFKSDLLRRTRNRLQSEGSMPDTILFEGFDADSYQNWHLTGQAFGDAPVKSATPAVTGDSLGVAHRGTAHSGIISRKLQGAMRSRTFTIDKDMIWYRVSGKGATINLIIDGFQQIRDPIYGKLTFKTDSPEAFMWHVQEVKQWKGHRAYIEILDNGEEHVAVDEIRFADYAAPKDRPANALILRMLESLDITSLEKLAAAYGKLFAETIRASQGFSADSPPSRDEAEIIDILLSAISGAILADARVSDLNQQCAHIESRLPSPRRGMALADGTAENERLFIRGSHKNLGDEIPRRLPEVFSLPSLAGARHASLSSGLSPSPGTPGEGRGEGSSPHSTTPDSADDGSGRLELARKLVGESSTLLRRVIVNRLWHHHFGEGLVRTPDDFGVMGQAPTDLELLDFLADELVRRDWSLKSMHRLILLSSTWQMSSTPDPRCAAIDPQNRLIQHMPVRRLEAEAIRDSILAVSGRLDPTLFGPPVPVHLTEFMDGRGRPKESGPLDGNGRRSIYINVRRNFLTPFFLAFDFPTPSTTVGKRNVSNVPAQALALMNDPFVIQQSGLWAQRLLADADQTAEKRIETLYLAAFARPPGANELNNAIKFIESQRKQYEQDTDLRAWSDLCHVLINTKEFIFVN